MTDAFSRASFMLPAAASQAVLSLVERALATHQLETGFLDWEGARIAFDVQVPPLHPMQKDEQVRGHGQRPEKRRVLVLVNGYQRTRLDFRAFRKRLATLAPHIVTVSLDNRGCGETLLTDLKTHPLTLERLARDAGALAGAVAAQFDSAGFACLGISMGGMVSQILAARCADVASCVLVSTTAGGHGRIWPDHVDPTERLAYREWPTDEAGMKRKMARYFGARFLARSPLLVDMMVKNMLKAQAEARAAAPESARGGEGGAESAHSGSRLQFEASATFDGTDLLPHIACPTLVVTGDEDFVIPKENASFLLSRLPNASLVDYSGAGHLILVEEPEAFVVDVANFLG
ncbi:MAG: alpha/beta fold hydrolase [Silvanigrellales bacterium]|nr:alpha/beta fold hydrolase [Silvanigrellales bacterium]